MCGISGIVQFEAKKSLLPQLKRMTDAIAHRGPDGEGHWQNDSGIVALGHRRLAIIDLTDEGKQPMHLLGRYTITFNGEIYNYLELKADLQKAGYQFSSHSDTEVLLALYDQKKEKCLDLLDGMFAFAIWDEQTQTLFCARDRFGEKPFFFNITDNQFYFTSEIKAFWSVNVPKIPNNQRIFDYLAFDKIEGINSPETTFFEGVYQLKPAHYFILSPATEFSFPKQIEYWKIDLNKRSNMTFEEAQKRFYELFSESISRRLRSDVPVGSSLSGGLDSSSIVCLINERKQELNQQHTFSARFPNFKKDEGTYIDLINSTTRSISHSVECTDSSLALLKPALHKIHDEPFGSTSIAAQYEVMRLAKEQNITVLLDGQGADEYLAGYTSFYLNYLAEIKSRSSSEYAQFLSAYQKHFGVPLNPGRTFFIDAKYPALRDFIRKVRNWGKKPTYLVQFDTAFLQKVDTSIYKTSFKRTLNEGLHDATTKTSLQTLLRYADRNSMANSREVRLPFLSHELVEFVFTLPSEFKIHEIWTKAILRFSMKNSLPDDICWRKEKIGFEPPNYKAVSDKESKWSVELLIEKGVLNREQVLPSKMWEYAQIAHLYD